MSDEMLKLADVIELVQKCGVGHRFSNDQASLIVSALRAAAASAEPVAWRWKYKEMDQWEFSDRYDDEFEGIQKPLYTRPAPDAEIVAALEAARDAVEYSIEVHGTDHCGIMLQAINKVDAALAKAKGVSQQCPHGMPSRERCSSCNSY